jgi:hypothetical protein
VPFISIVSVIQTAAFVELLDGQDKWSESNRFSMERRFLLPEPNGKYTRRLIEDTNGNYKWDTGNYEKKLQPEMVYYYPQLVELKALWELEQDWNVLSKPLDKQKLDELKKQKPDEDKKKKSNAANKQNSSSRRSY